MTFENAFEEELNLIADLNQRVYPIVAPKDLKAPALVYRKVTVEFKKTLSGATNKAEGLYDLVLLIESHAQLQQLGEDIKNKLLGFYGRNIGTEGPYIENVSVKFTGDQYEDGPNLLRSNIQLKVNY